MEFENPGAGTTTRYYHDGDGDGDVDIDDYLSYELCLTAPPDAVCLAFHDFDVAGESDGRVDLDDFGGLLNCFRGSGQPPPPECFRPAPAGEVPGSGSFALHGSMVDVLSGGRGPGDELALQYSRARYFDLKHGRFLQRDPKGYIDGANLYEAFASNPACFTDPMGEYITTDDPSIVVWILDRINGLMPFAFRPELTYKDPATAFRESIENWNLFTLTVMQERPWKIRLSLTMDEAAFLLDDAWWPIESEDDFRWLAWLAAAEEHFEFNDRDAVKRWYRRQAIRPIEEWLSSERVWSRVSGTGRVLGGAIVVAASLAVEGGSWGFATPLAVGGAAWSGDQIGTGLAEIWTGKYKSSLGGDAIEYALGDGTVGRIATLGYDIGPDLGVAVAAPRIFGNTARVGGYTMREVRGRWWGGSAPSRPNALMPRGREYMELSHTYISDKGRIGRLLPDSIKNRAWNLRPMWGSEHALVDPARYRLMSAEWKATNPLRSAPLRLWGRMPVGHKIVAGGGLTVTVIFAGEYIYDEISDEWNMWDP